MCQAVNWRHVQSPLCPRATQITGAPLREGPPSSVAGRLVTSHVSLTLTQQVRAQLQKSACICRSPAAGEGRGAGGRGGSGKWHSCAHKHIRWRDKRLTSRVVCAESRAYSRNRWVHVYVHNSDQGRRLWTNSWSLYVSFYNFWCKR